jgi:hypothetical protein
MDELKTNTEGGLQMLNKVRTITELKPISSQDKKEVPTSYTITAQNTVEFDVKNHSIKAALVIDPTLVWATYFSNT